MCGYLLVFGNSMQNIVDGAQRTIREFRECVCIVKIRKSLQILNRLETNCLRWVRIRWDCSSCMRILKRALHFTGEDIWYRWNEAFICWLMRLRANLFFIRAYCTLRFQMKQQKAYIHYPPSPLHTELNLRMKTMRKSNGPLQT